MPIYYDSIFIAICECHKKARTLNNLIINKSVLFFKKTFFKPCFTASYITFTVRVI